MVLVVDNYDSFVHNLARYCRRLGQDTLVLRNDDDRLRDDTLMRSIRALVISPGPCSPDEAGESLRLVHEHHEHLPILGICLGHQAIVQSLGGRIVRSTRPVHGQATKILHDESYEFAGISSPCLVARYHSLIAEFDSIPNCLEISARTDEGAVMAVRHRRLPVFGWQFHPESILTKVGFKLLSRFFELAKLDVNSTPTFESEHRVSTLTKSDDRWPLRPITF